MNETKTLIKETLLHFVNYHKAILIGLGILISLSQLTAISSYITKNVTHRAIIYSNDNDGGRSIETVMNTRWYNSNHFRPYGNLYFRIAHTLEAFGGYSGLDENLSEIEQEEVSHHRALMLTSLLSLYALAFLIAIIISKDWIIRLMIAPIIFTSFLYSSVHVNLFLRPHPDHLLSLMVAISAYASFFLFKFPKSKKYYFIAAMAWGITTAVKTSTILFAPAIILHFFPPINRNQFKRALQFVGIMFVAYLAVGFPQNLSVGNTIGFLMVQKVYNVSPDWGSVKDWTNLLYDQLKYPLPIILILTLIFSDYKTKLKPKFAIFIIIPFIVLFSRKILSIHYYYTLPFVAFLLIGLALILKSKLKINMPYKYLGAFLTLIIFKFSFGFEPQTLAAEFKKQQKCRPEAETVYKTVRSYQVNNDYVMLDPYFPLDFAQGEKRVYEWGLKERLITEKVKLIGLRSGFYQRYIDNPYAPSYRKHETTDWHQSHLFYSKLKGKTDYTDPLGREWRRTHHDQCGFEVWELNQ